MRKEGNGEGRGNAATSPQSKGREAFRNLRELSAVDIVGGGKAVFLVHKGLPSGMLGGWGGSV